MRRQGRVGHGAHILGQLSDPSVSLAPLEPNGVRALEIDNESFLDHWNFVPTPYDEWWDELGTGDSRDPDGWWLLTVEGEPAAICLLDERRAEMNEGYVGILGVRR